MPVGIVEQNEIIVFDHKFGEIPNQYACTIWEKYAGCMLRVKLIVFGLLPVNSESWFYRMIVTEPGHRRCLCLARLAIIVTRPVTK